MTDENQLDPTNTLSLDDPGDETQRAFRYQHACGVILLIAGARGHTPYRAIWCEHHEDLLAERKDGCYDAYQVKTRRPEIGDWTLSDEAITGSIKKFVVLSNLFGEKISNFILLSNTEFMKCGLDIADKKKVKRSLLLLLDAVKQANVEGTIPAPFDEVTKNLATNLGCSVAELFWVLKKVKCRKGPPRESFESVLAHEHLTKLEKCHIMSPAALNAIRDELIQKVYQASSLHTDNPDQNLYNIGEGLSPTQKAKRLPVEVVHECIENSGEFIFRYQPSDNSITPASLGTHSAATTLEKKFERGNLQDQFQTMKRRTISAERRLFELNSMNPQKATELLNQLEAVVQAECDEAALETISELKANSLPNYGPDMLNNIHKRLKKISNDSPKMVQHQPYETLVGIAGLLTENCSVWWSEKFDLKSAV